MHRTTIGADATCAADFRTETLEVVERHPVSLLSPEVTRADALIRACGWCNRIDVGCEDWTEVEEAVGRLALLAREAMPRLSHGICAPCHA